MTYVVNLTVFGVNIHLDPLIQLTGRGELILCVIVYMGNSRIRYVDLICSLLKPQGRILMCSLSYERLDRTGKLDYMGKLC